MSDSHHTLPAPLDYIDGAWQEPDQVADAWLCDANTGRRLLPQAASGIDAVRAAIGAAERVHRQGLWITADRAAYCDRIATHIEQYSERIAQADALTTGVLQSLTALFATVAAHAFRSAAAQLREDTNPAHLPGTHGPVHIHRVPLGPAAIIAPWNAPAVIAAHKAASALAAGCPVILKPSEWSPSSCELLTQAIAAADVPAGVFQLVHGAADVGSALVSDSRIRAVSFTGGLVGGRAVAAACAHDIKPVQLELGGINPLVVLPGADIQASAQGIVDGLITMGGQWCRAIGRVLIHDALVAPVLEAVLSRLANVRLGSSLAEDSQMGPLAHERHLHAVRTAVATLRERGGKVHQVTPAPSLSGWFFPPTLITNLDIGPAGDEIFGPVATVHPFTDTAEMLSLANASRYGLAAYVFGPADQCAIVAPQLRAGVIKIGGVRLMGLHPLAPRPAWGLSGLGDEGTRETFAFFRGNRVVGSVEPQEPIS